MKTEILADKILYKNHLINTQETATTNKKAETKTDEHDTANQLALKNEIAELQPMLLLRIVDFENTYPKSNYINRLNYLYFAANEAFSDTTSKIFIDYLNRRTTYAETQLNTVNSLTQSIDIANEINQKILPYMPFEKIPQPTQKMKVNFKQLDEAYQSQKSNPDIDFIDALRLLSETNKSNNSNNKSTDEKTMLQHRINAVVTELEQANKQNLATYLTIAYHWYIEKKTNDVIALINEQNLAVEHARSAEQFAMWDILVDAYIKQKKSDKAIEMLQALAKSDLYPVQKTYVALRLQQLTQ